MASAAPLPQHLEALERANAVRLERAARLREVKTPADAAGIIAQDPAPWWAESLSVGELLQRPTRWGRRRMLRVLAQVPVSETKAIGGERGLTPRQRMALVALLTR